MAVGFNLVKRSNPLKKDEPKKWYATTKTTKSMDKKLITRLATANTSTSPFEMEASLELLADYIPNQLRQGNTVSIPGLGTFWIIFQSEGAEDISEFNASNMIKNVRIQFRPSVELRNKVMNGLKFTNEGVMEDGICYSSVNDYKKAKGLNDGEEAGPAPGE